MSEPISQKPQSYRVAVIAAALGLAVLVIAAREAVVKLSNDDCVSVTRSLPNGSTQTVQTCS